MNSGECHQDGSCDHGQKGYNRPNNWSNCDLTKLLHKIKKLHIDPVRALDRFPASVHSQTTSFLRACISALNLQHTVHCIVVVGKTLIYCIQSDMSLVCNRYLQLKVSCKDCNPAQRPSKLAVSSHCRFFLLLSQVVLPVTQTWAGSHYRANTEVHLIQGTWTKRN